jgi:hypothetical protein
MDSSNHCSQNLYCVVYDKEVVNICDNYHIILSGSRDASMGLWQIDLTAATSLNAHWPAVFSNFANAVLPASITGIVSFYHAMGSPARSTFIHALSKAWIKFPGLSTAMVQRHQPTSVATAKGHLTQHRAGINSTSIGEEWNETAGDWCPTPKARTSLK